MGLVKGRAFLIEGTSSKHTEVGACLTCEEWREGSAVSRAESGRYVYLELGEGVEVKDRNLGVISLCMVFKAMRLDEFAQRMSTDREKWPED